ncbi:hypothetical protein [Mesorhizobium sp. J428]|uniref:hypothetical protein n=1 Tax=Mesorhizobium sp. J428 TaxID=2898440 RepID=UPI002150AAC3|nr:hypothetical protein [Mesorhizobium sp. J428]MCR5855248.1 hypothetical protein [Mesorhizobium sp. J428]
MKTAEKDDFRPAKRRTSARSTSTSSEHDHVRDGIVAQARGKAGPTPSREIATAALAALPPGHPGVLCPVFFGAARHLVELVDEIDDRDARAQDGRHRKPPA